jgi:hypothetical protein
MYGCHICGQGFEPGQGWRVIETSGDKSITKYECQKCKEARDEKEKRKRAG